MKLKSKSSCLRFKCGGKSHRKINKKNIVKAFGGFLFSNLSNKLSGTASSFITDANGGKSNILTGGAGSIGGAIGNNAGDLVAGVASGVGQGAGKLLENTASGVANGATSLMSAPGNAIGNTFSSIGNGIGNLGTGIGNLGAGISKAALSPFSAIADVIGKFKGLKGDGSENFRSNEGSVIPRRIKTAKTKPTEVTTTTAPMSKSTITLPKLNVQMPLVTSKPMKGIDRYFKTPTLTTPKKPI